MYFFINYDYIQLQQFVSICLNLSENLAKKLAKNFARAIARDKKLGST